MSDRHITHMVPEDGTEHTPVECYCHPEIHESNGTAALMGLDEAGVSPSEEGALTFMHHKAAETSQWTHWTESDDALADAWDEGHRAALELFPARPEDNPYRQDQP